MLCEKCQNEVLIKPRSDKQNKAYFGIAVQRLADKYNVRKETMHKALAGAYFGFDEIQIGELIIKVPKTTTGRTTKEFKEFYEFIQQTGADVGVDIPDPKEKSTKEA